MNVPKMLRWIRKTTFQMKLVRIDCIIVRFNELHLPDSYGWLFLGLNCPRLAMGSILPRDWLDPFVFISRHE